MRKWVSAAVFLFLADTCFSGDFPAPDSSKQQYIKVHFLYGSKPKRKFRSTESWYFGGLHGGHVTIEVDRKDYGLVPVVTKNVHIFARKKKKESAFSMKETNGRALYGGGQKSATVIIPVNALQYEKAGRIFESYRQKVPYDYAFFGMRCAAAAREVLGQLGVFKEHSNFRYVAGTFYPKKLRRRLLRKAEKNHWTVIRQEGRPSRKWERG